MDGLSNTNIQDNPNFVYDKKVPVVDAKGRPMRNPVFLDGHGQAQKNAGVAPGIQGSVILTAGSRLGLASFNVYDYLGQKITLQPLGRSVYVPETAAALAHAHSEMGLTNAEAMLEAKASNNLPLLMFTSPRGSEGGSEPSVMYKATASGQHDAVTSPGITITFQDYRPADLSVIPGIYSA